MTTLNCNNCSWFVDRPKNAWEIKVLRIDPNIIIDTRFCTLGGCDGSMFIDRKGERKWLTQDRSMKSTQGSARS